MQGIVPNGLILRYSRVVTRGGNGIVISSCGRPISIRVHKGRIERARVQ